MSELGGVADICVGVGFGADIRVKFARKETAKCVERIDFECEGLGVRGEFERRGDNDWWFCVPREKCRKAFSGFYRVGVWMAEGSDKIVVLRGQGQFCVRGKRKNGESE